MCITHSVFFFGVRKDAFNGLFTLLVKILALRCIAGVVRQVLVILPDMPLYTSLRSPWNGYTVLWSGSWRISSERSCILGIHRGPLCCISALVIRNRRNIVRKNFDYSDRILYISTRTAVITWKDDWRGSTAAQPGERRVLAQKHIRSRSRPAGFEPWALPMRSGRWS